MKTITKNTLIHTKEKIISLGNMINTGDELLNEIEKMGQMIRMSPDNLDLKSKQQDKAMEYLRVMEMESQFGLMESVTETYRGTVKEFSRRLMRENKCDSVIEKMIANNIAHLYIRILDNSRRLNNEFNCKEITRNRTAYISQIAKQLDRTMRQFNESLFILRQIQSPVFNIRVQTQNAFIANNQQINHEKKNNEA